MEEKLEEQNKPDWAIGDLYRQAWGIIRKHKVLWVFGMAAGVGVGMNNVFNNSFSKGDFGNFFEKFNQNQKTPSEINHVLGSSTSFFSDTFLHLFSATPLSFYIILGIEFLFIIVISILINLVYSSWATGSLLSGIQTAIAGGKPTIKDASAKAMPHIKPLIWLALVPIVVFALTAVAVLLFFSLGLMFAGGVLKNIFLVLLFIVPVVFLIAVFLLSLTQIWAQRQVILDNKGGKEALFASFQMVKKKFWAMLLLAIINNILIIIAVGVPIGIIVGIFLGGLFTSDLLGANTKTLVWIIASLATVIVVLFAFFLPVLGGIINAFKATVWSIAYNNIKGKYDK